MKTDIQFSLYQILITNDILPDYIFKQIVLKCAQIITELYTILD